MRDGMGRAARAHAARFSWPATAAVVEAELRRLTGLPPRAAPATVAPDAVVPTPRVPADEPAVEEAAG